jgi:GAF domain-containing protein
VTNDPAVELAETFGRVATTLLSERDLDATLQRIVDLAVETLDACEHAGISILEHRSIRSGPRTDECPAIMDALQDELDEGPCYDAIREHGTIRTGHLPEEKRWPQFSERGHAATGVNSVLSLQLFHEQDTMGALNLYSTQVDAFNDVDIAVATVFAVHASVAMANRREAKHLREAIETRDVIGQAKGVLMARMGLSEDEAFEMLRRASQRLNVKLRLVAEDVARTGEAPDDDA